VDDEFCGTHGVEGVTEGVELRTASCSSSQLSAHIAVLAESPKNPMSNIENDVVDSESAEAFVSSYFIPESDVDAGCCAQKVDDAESAETMVHNDCTSKFIPETDAEAERCEVEGCSV